MTDSLRGMPRYVRVRPDGQWQGADHQNGPWRNIPAPQRGTPWQAPTHTQQPSTIDPTLSDRIALAVCPRRSSGASSCEVPCDGCRRDSAAVAHEIADWLRECHGGASTTADLLDGVGCHQPARPAGWQPIGPDKEVMALAIGRELRRHDV